MKLLSDQEKAYQEQKEEENNRKVTKLKDELSKLKSFALVVIDEQQRVTDQLAQQMAKVQELQAAARDAQEELNSVKARAQQMESQIMHLEAELLDQAVHFHQKQEALSTKLTDENSQNRHLRQKLSTLCQQLDELEQSNKALCRTEKELQDLRDKNRNEEKGNSRLASEVEELRKRVEEMEGNNEELIKMDDLCGDLKRKLERESTQNCSLKAEVGQLNHRIMELEKLEDAFGKSKKECSSLKCNLEKERTVTKHLCNELDNLRARIKELEAAEEVLEKTEWTLKKDLTKLKTLAVMLVEERKTMAEKLKQLENKAQVSTDKLQAEQDKVRLVTEKLIEESKKALKTKVEMEEKVCISTKERDDLKSKLKSEEEKNNALQSKISMIKNRLQSLETVEREFLRNKAKQENTKEPIYNAFQQKDNKINDLTQEEEWLRKNRREMSRLEDDLAKTHNEGESFINRYSNDKALMEELIFESRELSEYQLDEKENLIQEHNLYKQLKKEEVKSSHLTKEVEALKEKIHNFTDTEESMCNMKTEYATLRRKLTQQEVRNKELTREKDSLTRELERYRHFSKSLRPGMIGRRFSDLQVSTKEVQTEPTDNPTPTYKNLSLLEQAEVNGKIYEECEPNYNEINPSKCNPLLKNSINHQNNTKQIRNPLLKSIEEHPLNTCKMQTTQNGMHIQQGDTLISHNPSQHLWINSHNTDTLEITSPTPDNARSYTTKTVIPTSVCYTKQQITIVQNATVSPQKKKSHPSIESPSTPEQSVPPLSTTTYSQTVIPEFTIWPTDSAMSTTEITTITTGVSDIAQETKDVKAGRTVLCVTPQRQNTCHVHRNNSSNPSVITNKNNKIPIHLGIPFLHPINSNTESSSPCYKVNSKTASSIRIKSASFPIP